MLLVTPWEDESRLPCQGKCGSASCSDAMYMLPCTRSHGDVLIIVPHVWTAITGSVANNSTVGCTGISIQLQRTCGITFGVTLLASLHAMWAACIKACIANLVKSSCPCGLLVKQMQSLLRDRHYAVPLCKCV